MAAAVPAYEGAAAVAAYEHAQGKQAWGRCFQIPQGGASEQASCLCWRAVGLQTVRCCPREVECRTGSWAGEVSGNRTLSSLRECQPPQVERGQPLERAPGKQQKIEEGPPLPAFLRSHSTETVTAILGQSISHAAPPPLLTAGGHGAQGSVA